MASGAYKNKTGLPFLFSFCLIFSFFNKLSENVGEAAGRQAGSRAAMGPPRSLGGGDSTP